MKFQGHKVLVIGDIHDSPKIPQDRLTWIGKYAKKTKPDYIIQIGDFGSFDSLSFFQDLIRILFDLRNTVLVL